MRILREYAGGGDCGALLPTREAVKHMLEAAGLTGEPSAAAVLLIYQTMMGGRGDDDLTDERKKNDFSRAGERALGDCTCD
jgi:hypothetical protein